MYNYEQGESSHRVRRPRQSRKWIQKIIISVKKAGRKESGFFFPGFLAWFMRQDSHKTSQSQNKIETVPRQASHKTRYVVTKQGSHKA